MKQLRLCIVFLLGFLAFICFLSYLTGLEIGAKGEGWVPIVGIASAAVCYLLARYWAAHDKLPDEAEDPKNDRA